MERLNPRFVRRVLLPASYLAFLFGALISAAIFFRSRPFDVKAAVLSDLQSPDENPQGYGASAIGTAVFAVLLAPATIVFHRRLFQQSPRLVRTGSMGFVIGLASAIAIGALAPTTHGYTPLHIQLASAAFIGISAGTLLHLLAARRSGPAAFAASGAPDAGFPLLWPGGVPERSSVHVPGILGMGFVPGLRCRFVGVSSSCRDADARREAEQLRSSSRSHLIA